MRHFNYQCFSWYFYSTHYYQTGIQRQPDPSVEAAICASASVRLPIDVELCTSRSYEPSIVSWVVDSSRQCTSSCSLSLTWIKWSLRLVALGPCQYQDNLSNWRSSWLSWESSLEAFCASLEVCQSGDAEVHFIHEDFRLSASRTYTLWWGAATSAGKSATNLILQEFGVLLLISLLSSCNEYLFVTILQCSIAC
jgi:hypothetical protein